MNYKTCVILFPKSDVLCNTSVELWVLGMLGKGCSNSDCFQGILDNGPAQKIQTSKSLQEAGDQSGDPFEISTIRREVSIGDSRSWDELDGSALFCAEYLTVFS
jgi:hypothetical protein